jgi:surface antigen
MTTGFATGPKPGPVAAASTQIPFAPGPARATGTEPRLTVSLLRSAKVGEENATVPAVRRYTVQSGDTLASIATRLRLRPQTLVWANPALSGHGLQPGDLLLVPAVDGVIHIVAAGETPEGLSRAFGIDAATLLDYNGIRSASQVRPGTRLLIPGSKPPAQANLYGGGAISYQASNYNNFPWGWCTWYVAQRRDIPWRGDAWSWYTSARLSGWKTGSTPQVGAVMVTRENYYYGHVAFVERVNPDGSWVVSEMNYKQFGEVDFRTVEPGKVPLIGFVY